MDDRLNRHDLTDEEWQRLLRLAARGGRIAAPMIDQTNRRQVLVLRELGRIPSTREGQHRAAAACP